MVEESKSSKGTEQKFEATINKLFAISLKDSKDFELQINRVQEDPTRMKQTNEEPQVQEKATQSNNPKPDRQFELIKQLEVVHNRTRYLKPLSSSHPDHLIVNIKPDQASNCELVADSKYYNKPVDRDAIIKTLDDMKLRKYSRGLLVIPCKVADCCDTIYLLRFLEMLGITDYQATKLQILILEADQNKAKAYELYQILQKCEPKISIEDFLTGDNIKLFIGYMNILKSSNESNQNDSNMGDDANRQKERDWSTKNFPLFFALEKIDQIAKTLGKTDEEKQQEKEKRKQKYKEKKEKTLNELNGGNKNGNKEENKEENKEKNKDNEKQSIKRQMIKLTQQFYFDKDKIKEFLNQLFQELERDNETKHLSETHKLIGHIRSCTSEYFALYEQFRYRKIEPLKRVLYNSQYYNYSQTSIISNASNNTQTQKEIDAINKLDFFFTHENAQIIQQRARNQVSRSKTIQPAINNQVYAVLQIIFEFSKTQDEIDRLLKDPAQAQIFINRLKSTLMTDTNYLGNNEDEEEKIGPTKNTYHQPNFQDGGRQPTQMPRIQGSDSLKIEDSKKAAYAQDSQNQNELPQEPIIQESSHTPKKDSSQLSQTKSQENVSEVKSSGPQKNLAIDQSKPNEASKSQRLKPIQLESSFASKQPYPGTSNDVPRNPEDQQQESQDREQQSSRH